MKRQTRRDLNRARSRQRARAVAAKQARARANEASPGGGLAGLVKIYSNALKAQKEANSALRSAYSMAQRMPPDGSGDVKHFQKETSRVMKKGLQLFRAIDDILDWIG